MPKIKGPPSFFGFIHKILYADENILEKNQYSVFRSIVFPLHTHIHTHRDERHGAEQHFESAQRNVFIQLYFFSFPSFLLLEFFFRGENKI